MKKFLCLFIISLFSVVFAADIEVDAYVNRTTIGVNDILEYTISISGENADKIGTPELPNINGFRNGGVSTSSSSSYTYSGGKFNASVTKEYVYSLIPQKTGRLTIPSITLKYKKKSYKTRTIKIHVVQGSNEPAPKTSNSYSQQKDNSSEKLSDNLFIEVEVSDNTPYQNEPVTIKYTMYSRYNVTSLSFKEDQAYTGFWKEDVFTPSKINFKRTNKNGVIFNRMVLKEVALFPALSGKVVVEPLAMSVDIQTNSRSFFSFGSSQTYTIKSKPVTFNIKSLPENAPDNFTGAVGAFRMNSSISETEMKVGEPFTWSVTLTGKGNFNNLELGKLPEVNHLRFFDPETSTQVANNKVSGSKTISYLVMPQEVGTFQVPSLSFAYFDYQKKKYQTLKTPVYKIEVAEGDQKILTSSTSQSIVSQENFDIGFIVDSSLQNQSLLLHSPLYWFIVILLFLAFPFTVIMQKRYDSLSSDQDYQRQKLAAKVLKKYLKLADDHYKQGNQNFYSAVQSGLSSYLTDKLKIAKGSRIEDIISAAVEKEIPEELIFELEMLFRKCNEARFMPGGFSKENIDNDYNKLQSIISELSKLKLRRKK